MINLLLLWWLLPITQYLVEMRLVNYSKLLFLSVSKNKPWRTKVLSRNLQIMSSNSPSGAGSSDGESPRTLIPCQLRCALWDGFMVMFCLFRWWWSAVPAPGCFGLFGCQSSRPGRGQCPWVPGEEAGPSRPLRQRCHGGSGARRSLCGRNRAMDPRHSLQKHNNTRRSGHIDLWVIFRGNLQPERHVGQICCS